MTALPAGADAALTPLREALRDAAEATADSIRADSRKQCDALILAAASEAARIRATARAEGQSAARAEAALTSARARRRAHETVLFTQNAMRERLLEQVRERALALRLDDRYPAVLARLADLGRTVLGAHALLTESPDGGLIAEAGSRRLDLSLPTLALDAAAARGPQITTLWSSR